MNTNLLYQIATAGLTFFQEARLLKSLNNLNAALNNQAGAPNAETIKAVGAAVDNVRSLLEKARDADYFPRTWMPAIEEIGFARLLPTPLMAEVEGVISGNQLVITEAVKRLTGLIATVTTFNEAFSAIKNQFDKLNLTAVPPPPGEGELSIVIPRGNFDNELSDFWREIKVIDWILEAIRESVDPASDRIEIKQISTTDPMIMLAASISVVMAVLKAVDQILVIYERTLSIRKMKAEMTKIGNLDSAVQALNDSVSKTISDGLAQIKEEFCRQHLTIPRDGHREKELSISFEKAVDELAAQIDNGVRIEGDATPPDRGTQSDEQAQPTAVEAQVVEIKRIARKIHYFQMEGEPILKLSKRRDKEEG